MIKILFICYGNICRSPMAEFLMKNELKKRNLNGCAVVESAGTSNEEEGHGVYREVYNILNSLQIDCSKKHSRPLNINDYARFDYFLTMDSFNFSETLSIFGGDAENKVLRLGDFLQEKKDIADPWYTRDFALCYNEIQSAVCNFIEFLLAKSKLRRE